MAEIEKFVMPKFKAGVACQMLRDGTWETKTKKVWRVEVEGVVTGPFLPYETDINAYLVRLGFETPDAYSVDPRSTDDTYRVFYFYNHDKTKVWGVAASAVCTWEPAQLPPPQD
jgi:hypothetical protein